VTIVVDASAVAAVLFLEPEAASIKARIIGETLVAPALLAFEIANACVTRQRRESVRQQSARATYSVFLEWSIRMMPVDHADVVSLALSTRLTAYDASYLWLARHLGCELVTLDRRLGLAASA
jgi:predicted nucleic acid-binding protein